MCGRVQPELTAVADEGHASGRRMRGMPHRMLLLLQELVSMGGRASPGRPRRVGANKVGYSIHIVPY